MNISVFPFETQLILEEICSAIQATVPNDVEVISYQMPAFKLHGILVWFAAYRKHIGFYPCSSGIKAFEKEISGYTNSKGAVQFPIEKPIPFELIVAITKFRVNEDIEKSESKKEKMTNVVYYFFNESFKKSSNGFIILKLSAINSKFLISFSEHFRLTVKLFNFNNSRAS